MRGLLFAPMVLAVACGGCRATDTAPEPTATPSNQPTSAEFGARAERAFEQLCAQRSGESYDWQAPDTAATHEIVRMAIAVLQAPEPRPAHPGLRSKALTALGCAGSHAAPAVPALASALAGATETGAQTACLHALKRIDSVDLGPAAYALEATLRSHHAGGFAAQLLARVNPDGIARLRAHLDHPDPVVRRWAATGCGYASSDRDTIAATLRPLLDDADPSVRRRAAEAIARLQP